MKWINKTMLLGWLGCAVLAQAGGDISPVVMSKNVARTETTVATITESDHRFYVGAALGAGRANTYYYGKDTVGDLMIQAGVNLLSFLDLEARGYIGLVDGDDLEHTYTAAVYLKPHYGITDDVDIYALAGYGQTRVTYVGNISMVDDTTTQNGFSYGAGLQYRMNDDIAFFIDYTLLIDKDTVKTTGPYAEKVETVTLGVSYYF